MRLLFTLLIGLILLVCLGNKLLAKSKTPSSSEPQIKFNREFIDIGKVREGAILFRSFKVTNLGAKPLKILETKSTCGCTVPEIKKSVLKSLETTILKVKIDTSMKQNKVTKTLDVHSSDPVRPIVTLSMALNVENRHKNLSSKGKSKILTDEKCMTCHVYQGVGAFGKDLYDADCAMCHGLKGEGASGPNLLIGGYKNPALVQSRRQTIACGSKNNNSMPGYEYTCNGPLSIEQINSLVEYLKSLSE